MHLVYGHYSLHYNYIVLKTKESEMRKLHSIGASIFTTYFLAVDIQLLGKT